MSPLQLAYRINFLLLPFAVAWALHDSLHYEGLSHAGLVVGLACIALHYLLSLGILLVDAPKASKQLRILAMLSFMVAPLIPVAMIIYPMNAGELFRHFVHPRGRRILGCGEHFTDESPPEVHKNCLQCFGFATVTSLIAGGSILCVLGTYNSELSAQEDGKNVDIEFVENKDAPKPAATPRRP